jgi:hemerythrin-like domain-containing protein
MSDPFRTLVDHNHSAHVALQTLFEQCLRLVRARELDRATLLEGIADAVVALRAHHRYEDELLLPKMRAAGADGPWDQVAAEHGTLSDDLAALEAAAPSGPSDLSDLEAPLARIVALLGPHFASEEAALTESAWRGIFFDDSEAARAFGKQVAAHNRAGLQPSARLLPLLVYNLGPRDRARFTERMPSFVVDGLVPYAFRPAWRSRRAFMAYPPPRLTPRPLRGLRARLRM